MTITDFEKFLSSIGNLIKSLDHTYTPVAQVEHNFKVGDMVKIKASDGLGIIAALDERYVQVIEYDSNLNPVYSVTESTVTTWYKPEDLEEYEPEEDNMVMEEPDGYKETDNGINNTKEIRLPTDENESVVLYKNAVLTIFKDQNGDTKFVGIYSNKFRDDDNPSDILSEEAHVKFVTKVQTGKVPFPDLCIAHIQEKPIGKAEIIDYDMETGMSIVGGRIYPNYVPLVKELIANTKEDMGMSHGFYTSTVRKDDNGVITDYVSHEVSLLPQTFAANRLTNFNVGV